MTHRVPPSDELEASCAGDSTVCGAMAPPLIQAASEQRAVAVHDRSERVATDHEPSGSNRPKIMGDTTDVVWTQGSQMESLENRDVIRREVEITSVIPEQSRGSRPSAWTQGASTGPRASISSYR